MEQAEDSHRDQSGAHLDDTSTQQPPRWRKWFPALDNDGLTLHGAVNLEYILRYCARPKCR
jgi:hypothetical protein